MCSEGISKMEKEGGRGGSPWRERNVRQNYGQRGEGNQQEKIKFGKMEWDKARGKNGDIEYFMRRE